MTEVPEQTLFWLALIETLATTLGLTTIEIEFEVDGLPVTQDKLDVIITYIMSLLMGIYEYVLPVAIGTVFLYH